MKKLIIFLFLSLLFSSLLSFNLWSADKIEVVTTLPDFKNFVEIIGQDKVHVISIAKGYLDPHHVEIKPSDILKIKNADLLVINGLDLDIWIYPLILNSRNPKVQKGVVGFIDASEGIEVLEAPVTKIDRSMGDVHPYGNPHYNLSPTAMRIAFSHILYSMMKTYPQHEKVFEKNGQDYLKKLDAKIIEWKNNLKKIPQKQIVSYHNSWSYFFNDFGLKSGGYMEPKPGIMPSPSHSAELIKRMNNEKTNIILKEVYFSDSTANFIADKTGAKVIEVPTSSGGNDQTPDYISLIDFLVQSIANQ